MFELCFCHSPVYNSALGLIKQSLSNLYASVNLRVNINTDLKVFIGMESINLAFI